MSLRRTAVAIGCLGLFAAIPLALTVQAQEPPPLERIGGPRLPDDQDASDRRISLAGVVTTRPAALLLASFDRDQNYEISLSEVTAGLDAAFAALDQDADGRVSVLDYSDWAERALAARYAPPSGPAIDSNLDASVSREEFTRAFMGLAADYGLSADASLGYAALLRPLRPSETGERPGGERPEEGPGGPQRPSSGGAGADR